MATFSLFTRYVFGSTSDADWNFRSSGALVADRLETQANRDAWVWPDATAGNVSLDTSVKVSGAAGSFKHAVLSADTSASGLVGVPFSPAIGQGGTVWFSYRYRAPIEHAYQAWSVADGPAAKISILAETDETSVANEVVMQINDCRGELNGYHQDGTGFVTHDAAASTNCSVSDFKAQPSVDRQYAHQTLFYPLIGTNPDSGSSWSTCEGDRRRFAVLYSSGQAGTLRRGYGDVLSGGFRVKPDTWVTITCKVVIGTWGVANSSWACWAAYEGEGYTKLWDLTGVKLGSYSDYSKLWLLPYVTNRSAGGRKITAVGSEIGGIAVRVCAMGTPLGSATLEYVASTGLFRFKSSADNYGTARGYSVVNDVMKVNLSSSAHGVATTTSGSHTLPTGTITVASTTGFPTSGSAVIGVPDTTNGTSPGSGGVGEQRFQYTGVTSTTFTGCSGGTGTHDSGVPVVIDSYVLLEVNDPSLLPSSGTTTTTVTISEGRPDTQVNYNDAIVKNNAEIVAPGRFPPRLPTWVGSTGAWTQLSGTSLSSVDPNPALSAGTGTGGGLGNTGTAGKVTAWNGAAVDPRSSRVYIAAAGGHNDYGGNEVDVLHLERDTPVWEQLIAPTPSADIVNNVSYYNDGRPTSRHHFYGIVFNEHTNKVMLLGGSHWSTAGGFHNAVDGFDIRTNSYTSSGAYGSLSGNFTGDTMGFCTDPRTGHIYVFGNFAVGKLDRFTKLFAEILAPNGAHPAGQSGPSACDIERNRILLAGGFYAHHHYYDIAANTFTSITFTGTNASNVLNAVNGSQLVYVHALDRYLMMAGTGAGGVIYEIHPTTWACTTFATSGGGSIAGTANGCYARFSYVPRLQGCVFVDVHNAGVWFVKVH